MPGCTAARARKANPTCASILQYLDLHGGETVLDVGCGAGQHFAALRTAVGAEGRVIGLDYSPGMVKQARNWSSGRAGRTSRCAGVTAASQPWSNRTWLDTT